MSSHGNTFCITCHFLWESNAFSLITGPLWRQPQSPMDSPHKGLAIWCFYVFMLPWTNCWTNSWVVSDLGCMACMSLHRNAVHILTTDTIDQSHKSHNAPVPFAIMLHSEKKKFRSTIQLTCQREMWVYEFIIWSIFHIAIVLLCISMCYIALC